MFCNLKDSLWVQCRDSIIVLLIDLNGHLNVVPNSNLPGLRFYVNCICMIMKYSYLNDMEILGTKRFIPKGFELGASLS